MNDQPSITALGEVLWDVFPDGPRFGGAPANVASHAAALGARAAMVSQVGKDALGKQALQELEQRHVDVQCVGVSDGLPTGTVQVELDELGKPSFTISENVAWDALAWSDQLDALAGRTDAVCFGTLGQRCEPSRHVIGRFVSSVSPKALRVLDINLRPPFHDASVIRHSLALANVLKLSDEELGTVAAACEVSGSEAEVLAILAQGFDLELIALTRGASGATLIRKNERSDAEGISVDIKDTVGAGDAYTAAMILGVLSGDLLDTINRRANQVAAYVCSQSGATPPLPAGL